MADKIQAEKQKSSVALVLELSLMAGNLTLALAKGYAREKLLGWLGHASVSRRHIN